MGNITVSSDTKIGRINRFTLTYHFIRLFFSELLINALFPFEKWIIQQFSFFNPFRGNFFS